MVIMMISCCKKSFDDLYFNVKDITVKNTYNFRDISDGVTVNQEGYRIKLILNENTREAIEDINNVRKSLDYCEDNEVALKKDISKLSITCNHTLWETPAGSSLNLDNIRIVERSSENETNPLKVDEWIDLINAKIQFVDFEWYMTFTEPIISTDYLKFTLTFEIVDGNTYKTETETVKLE